MLRGDETSRIPTAQQLAQTGLPTKQQANRPTGEVTEKRLEEYLRKLSGGPFAVNMAQQQQNDRRVLASGQAASASAVDIFEKLDLDMDGKLSAREFAMSDSLHKLDLDDDETISTAELQPAFNVYFGLRSSRQQTTTNSSPFVHLDSSQSPTRLVRQLVDKYDRAQGDEGKDNKLSREELGMLAEAFVELDADGEGQLDFDELQQFIRNPTAQLDIIVRLGKRDDGAEIVEVTKSGNDLPFAGSVRKSADGLATLVVGKVQVEIGPQGGGRTVRQDVEATYKQYLQRYDQDNNAYLEKKETERSPFRNNFDLIDRDGDGKIFEKELLDYGKQVAAASQSRTSLTITDQGNKLFRIMDLNRDSRLNVRELTIARDKIAVWDEDDDSQITKEEIPRHWRLAISRGTATGGIGFAPVAYAKPGQSVVRPTGGPTWFQKMDRNRDVSQREFLGATKDFQKIDKDNDGLISAAEASELEPND